MTASTALPAGSLARPIPRRDRRLLEPLARIAREEARLATVKVKVWAEENPGWMLLLGLALGFVAGRVLLLFAPAPDQRLRVAIRRSRDAAASVKDR